MWPRRTCKVIVLCCALAVPAAGFPAETLLSGLGTISATYVRPTGHEAVLSAPAELDPTQLRIVISGTFFSEIDGMTYDAMYVTDEMGRRTTRHTLVHITPRELNYLGPGPMRHQFVYAFAPEASTPLSVAMSIDFQGIVSRLTLPDSQVRSSLSGGLRLELWGPEPRPPIWPIAVAAVASLLLTASAIGLVLRRRRPEPVDVGGPLAAIDGHYHRATALLADRTGPAGSAETARLLERLVEGAHVLGASITTFRASVQSTDLDQLDTEIADLHRHLTGAGDQETRVELRETLQDRYHVRDLISNAEANEERYLLRLSALQVAVEALETRLATEVETDAEEVVRELDEQLTFLEKTLHELRHMG